MTQSTFRISPSRLGALCNPNACLLCYWRLLRLKFQKPFSFPMPGVMFGLDSQQKQIARVMLEQEGKLPKYFGPFCDATEILDISTVSGFHADTGLELYGKPDLVLRDGNGSVLVIDNKTAKVKPDEHPLSSQYLVQTNFYGFVLENCPEAYTVARIGILHYEFDAMSDGEIPSFTKKDHVFSRFKPVIKEVEYDPEAHVVPLLEQVRDLLDDDFAPGGAEGCKDCQLLEAFQDLIPLKDAVMPSFLTVIERQRWMYTAQCREMKQIDAAQQRQLDSLPGAGVPGGVLRSWIDDDDLPD